MSYTLLKKKLNESIQENTNAAQWKTELHLRIALAFAPILFTAIGILLGIQIKKRSKAVGIGFSLVVILFYYGILLLVVPVASGGGFLHPIFLTWLPNFFMILMCAFLWKRLLQY